MFAAIALAGLMLAAPSSCEYKDYGVTVCRFTIVATRQADPGEVAVVRGQIKALDHSPAFDSVTKLTAGVGSSGTRGRSVSTSNNSFVAYSELAGWSTYATVRHAPGDDSLFRWAYAIFGGNEVGHVKIRTTTVIVPAG